MVPIAPGGASLSKSFDGTLKGTLTATDEGGGRYAIAIFGTFTRSNGAKFTVSQNAPATDEYNGCFRYAGNRSYSRPTGRLDAAISGTWCATGSENGTLTWKGGTVAFVGASGSGTFTGYTSGGTGTFGQHTLVESLVATLKHR
jgi:hypothetical protein